jgi:poly-gamma-glutamate synthesis protein (capsule biosynthesis protein)
MKLTFLGDIFPADESFCVGFGIHSQFQQHWGGEWKSNLLNFTRGSEYVIGNIESPLISTSMAISDIFYGHPQFAAFLKDCGVNVLNVANNHIMEHGTNGYEETLQTLKNKDIKVIGHNDEILYLREQDCCIAIAGFCAPNLLEHSFDNTLSILSKENVLSSLDAMHAHNINVKIFCFHWGNEYIHKPSMQQREFAYELIDAGADVIIGHHPHVIQPYEQYNNGHIFYSLGNFCFNNPYESKHYSRGMAVTVDIDIDKKQISDIAFSGVRLRQYKLVEKIDATIFNAYFSKIQNWYRASKIKENYEEQYKKEQKWRRFIERILMKTSMIILFFSIRAKDKVMLIKNVFHIFLSKTTNKNDLN